MGRKVLKPNEIAKILGSQIHDPDQDISIDLGSGLRAFMTASTYKNLKAGHKPEYKFFISKDDRESHQLENATPEELETISNYIWEKIAPQFAALKADADDLTPDWAKDKSDGGDFLTPDALREPKERDDLEPDPTGLIPDALRTRKK